MNNDDYYPLLIIIFWLASMSYTAIFAYEVLMFVLDARTALQFYVLRG